jgi:hypothetical protein
MKSETLTVRQIYQDRRQYCVPFYQRSYVWTLKNQWSALWEDVQEKAQARFQKLAVTPHFLGAVVLEPQPKEGLLGVDTLHIIDGQQRLTTLQYILASLLLALRETGNSMFEPIVLGCMQNSNEETMREPETERFKLWPTFKDQDHFVKSMRVESLNGFRSAYKGHFTQGGSLYKHAEHPSSLAAIWFFTNEFIRWLNADEESKPRRAECLIEAVVRDLKLVCIFLEEEDDAQVIFETLNGRGAELHATDLIRNYIFMRAGPDGVDAGKLYNNQWLPFEAKYWAEKQRRGRMTKPRMEWLIHATLQAETASEVDLARLYNEYRRYVSTSVPSPKADQQVATLQRYAEHYQALIGASGPSPLALLGRRLAAWDVTTLHPLALLISVGGPEDAEKAEMYRDLASYIVRRAVCGLTPKNYNNVFMNALRDLGKNEITAEVLRANLKSLEGEASRWPDDAEFLNACRTAPLFPGRLDQPKMRALLTEIEGQLRMVIKTEEPTIPDLAGLDIDHLLPRAWYEHWPLHGGVEVTQKISDSVAEIIRAGGSLTPDQELIRVRNRAIPTLGNLTLLNLSVNRSVQHGCFSLKREKLIAHTSLRLNIPLIPLHQWDEESIAKRGEMLGEIALTVWPKPL